MSALLPWLLDWSHSYGYPALWLCVFVASAGLPLPISLVLLASGAFAALGDFDLGLLFSVAVSASVMGDSTGYWLGRKLGHRLLLWLKLRRLRFLSPKTIQRSQDYFRRRGGLAVFLSRFLIPALGGTVNLLAGAELYSYWRFLLYDFSGEAIGAALPLVLGFSFAASWEALGDIMTWISILCLALLIVTWTCVYLVRMIFLRRRPL